MAQDVPSCKAVEPVPERVGDALRQLMALGSRLSQSGACLRPEEAKLLIEVVEQVESFRRTRHGLFRERLVAAMATTLPDVYGAFASGEIDRQEYQRQIEAICFDCGIEPDGDLLDELVLDPDTILNGTRGGGKAEAAKYAVARALQVSERTVATYKSRHRAGLLSLPASPPSATDGAPPVSMSEALDPTGAATYALRLTGLSPEDVEVMLLARYRRLAGLDG